MKLRVGTFNLFQFVEPPYSWYIKKDKFTNQQWQEKKTWIKEQIIKMNCDIIGFQEVFSQEALRQLVFDLGFKYFETVDIVKVKKENDKVYTSTTVAIASKYEITSLENVEVHGKSIKKHNFQGHFKFARKPIKANISLLNGENITLYICHLKSNRLNEFEYLFTKNDTLKDKKILVEKSLKEGYSKSLQQRLCEASSLYFDIKKSKVPTILMCDLNDKEFSITIDALTNRAYHKNIKDNSFLLNDACNLFEKKVYNPHPDAKEIKRIPTSYYQSKGNILDYIFVSNEFKESNKKYKAKICSYEVFDEHLQKNQNGSILQSDHAQVVCEVDFLN